MKLLSTFLLLLVAGHCHAIENRELYETVVQGSVTVQRGDEESILVNLQSPIHFYTDKYDSIYVSFPIGLIHIVDLVPPRKSSVHSSSEEEKRGVFLDHRKEGAGAVRHHIVPSCFVVGARHRLNISC